MGVRCHITVMIEKYNLIKKREERYSHLLVHHHH